MTVTELINLLLLVDQGAQVTLPGADGPPIERVNEVHSASGLHWVELS